MHSERSRRRVLPGTSELPSYFVCHFFPYPRLRWQDPGVCGVFLFLFFPLYESLPTWFNSSISMCSQSSVTCALSFALSCEDENCKLHISCSHSYTRVPFRDLFGYVNQFMNNRQRRCKTYPVCLLLRHHNF